MKRESNNNCIEDELQAYKSIYFRAVPAFKLDEVPDILMEE